MWTNRERIQFKTAALIPKFYEIISFKAIYCRVVCVKKHSEEVQKWRSDDETFVTNLCGPTNREAFKYFMISVWRNFPVPCDSLSFVSVTLNSTSLDEDNTNHNCQNQHNKLPASWENETNEFTDKIIFHPRFFNICTYMYCKNDICIKGKKIHISNILAAKVNGFGVTFYQNNDLEKKKKEAITT